MKIMPNSKRPLLVAMLLLVASVLIATTLAFGGRSARGQVVTVSTKGTQVRLPNKRTTQLRRAGINRVGLMTTRDHVAFYRLTSSKYPACFGLSNGAPERGPGLVKCRVRMTPLIDMSVIEITKQLREPRIVRANGIAADGIARVVLVDSAGSEVAETSVLNNTYHFSSVPHVLMSEIRALDATGGVVYTQPLSR